MAVELGKDRIRVNCVAPGVIRTAFHARMTEEQKKLRIVALPEHSPDSQAMLMQMEMWCTLELMVPLKKQDPVHP
jgi:NAD(P)-dependent dehydrogenase (short-subunit alcohol dehydrogenase family)